MSSTNKTSYLALNLWASTDTPKRDDLNVDNAKLDWVIKDHNKNKKMHVSDLERQKWNNPYYIGYYYGDGETTRVIETECPFTPVFGIVFAGGAPPSKANFDGKSKTNYFAILGTRMSMAGVSLSGSTIRLEKTVVPVMTSEYMSLNITGTTYCYILFR